MAGRAWWIAAGLLFGAAAVFSPGAIFILLLAGLTALALRACARREDRRFVVGLFLAGFLVRVFFSLGLDLGSLLAGERWPGKVGAVQGWEINIRDRTRSYLNLGDSDFFSDRAYALSEYARGKRETVLFLSLKKPRPHGYLYVMALFYYLFDFSPISVKFINGLIGALLAPLVFFLAQACISRWVARASALLAAFLPSLVLWSATNLKDPSFITLTALLFLLIVKIQQARTARGALLYGALVIPGILLHMTLRSDAGFSWALVGCAAVSYGLGRIHWVGRLAALGAGCAAVVLLWPRLFEKLTFAFYRHLGNVDFVSNPHTQTSRYLPEAFYRNDLYQEAPRIMTDVPVLLATMGRAVSHYLLEPTPARMGEISLAAVYPQMILWYGLLPFALLGAWFCLRRNFQRSGFLVTTLAVWILIGALAGGNVGLLFRIRDMVTPFLLILASTGLWRWLAPGPEAAP